MGCVVTCLPPQELINQFSAVLPSLDISVEDYDKQSIRIPSMHAGKKNYFSIIYRHDIFQDKMKGNAFNLQHEVLLNYLVPKFCVIDMKVC